MNTNTSEEKKKGMREIPPAPPKESKGRNKRTTDGDGDSCESSPRPRARVHAKAMRRRKSGDRLRSWMARLEAEGIIDPVPQVVDEAVRACGGTSADRLIWMKMANRGLNTFLGVLCEFECDLESPELRRPLNLAAAFQARLNRVLPRAKGGAK